MNRLSLALAQALGAGMALSIAAIPGALAQQANQQPQKIEKIEVTGSNIKRIEGETTNSVQIIKREDIERSGATSVQELVQQLTNNTGGASLKDSLTAGAAGGSSGSSIALHGLAQSNTLVLLNGRRTSTYAFTDAGTYANLNSIPLAAIERIEILKDGASAVYGSDALAGVVNFILRKDYQGAELSATLGESEQGGARNKHFTATAGTGNPDADRYNVFFSLDYNKNGELEGNDRPFSRSLNTKKIDSVFGVDARSSRGYPGNLLTSTGGSRRASPTCGTVPDPKFGTFLGQLSGTSCFFDSAPYFDLVPESERTALLGRGTFKINDNHSVYAELNYSYTKTHVLVSPTPIDDVFAPFSDPGLYILPATSPFYPRQDITGRPTSGPPINGRDIAVRSRSSPNGPRIDNYNTREGRFLVGLKGTLFTSWDYDTAIGQARSRTEDVEPTGFVSSRKLRQALAGTLPGFVGQFLDPLAIAGTAFTRDPTATPLTWHAIEQPSVRKSEYTTDFADFKVSSELFQLPAGPLALAAGAEFRRDKLGDFPDAAVSSDVLAGVAIGITEASRRQNAQFVELNIPIISTLESTVALRTDKYSDFGRTTNPKIGFKYQPIKSLLLRTSYTKGFRAPSLYELSSPAVLGATAVVTDPLRCPDGQNSINPSTPEDCGTQYNQITSGNKVLKAEESENFSFGAVWEPVQNLSLGATYWKINKANTIQFLAAGTILGDPKLLNDPTIVQRNPTPAVGDPAGLPPQIINVFAKYQNTGGTRTTGIDFDLAYRWNTSIGKFSITDTTTRLTKFDQKFTDSDTAFTQLAGHFLNATPLPKWRHYATVGYDTGPWTTTLTWQYVGEYDDENSGTDANGDTVFRKVSPWNVYGIQVAYAGLVKGLKISGGIKNFTDAAPPFSNQGTAAFATGYDGFTADPIGRFYYLGATYAFK